MQAGDLRSLVGFYKRPSSSGNSPDVDYGTPEADYLEEPDFTCSANIKPRLGGETVLAQRLTGTNLVNITVRQSSNTRLVDTGWRAKDERNLTVFNIRSIIDPFEGEANQGMWLELLCEKGVA